MNGIKASFYETSNNVKQVAWRQNRSTAGALRRILENIAVADAARLAQKRGVAVKLAEVGKK